MTLSTLKWNRQMKLRSLLRCWSWKIPLPGRSLLFFSYLSLSLCVCVCVCDIAVAFVFLCSSLPLSFFIVVGAVAFFEAKACIPASPAGLEAARRVAAKPARSPLPRCPQANKACKKLTRRRSTNPVAPPSWRRNRRMQKERKPPTASCRRSSSCLCVPMCLSTQ